MSEWMARIYMYMTTNKYCFCIGVAVVVDGGVVYGDI